MDADRLRAARDRSMVTSDVSSRTLIVSNPDKQLAGDIETESGGWMRLFKFKKPK
ncbi:MAG: hypothetical protein KAW09_10560 [Thermoplasmata archaeon]|nr:hypothetical protein [Thermoplasmata archaeon]